RSLLNLHVAVWSKIFRSSNFLRQSLGSGFDRACRSYTAEYCNHSGNRETFVPSPGHKPDNRPVQFLLSCGSELDCVTAAFLSTQRLLPVVKRTCVRPVMTQ